jgi:HD-GYP domain-containing protein (c-di-GMP phosphodiesterase class II)
MTSDRAYRKALPHEIACGELERCVGSQFDPRSPSLHQIEEFRKIEANAGRSSRVDPKIARGANAPPAGDCHAAGPFPRA